MVFVEPVIRGGLLEELESSDTYVAVSPVGENVKMLTQQVKAKP
jgi:hypothetical protein